MTVPELQQHLLSHTLYVLLRELTVRDNPKKVSFLVIQGEQLQLIDNTVHFLLQGDGATLSPHGCTKVVHLFNRWTHTTDDWVNLLSERLYGEATKIIHISI